MLVQLLGCEFRDGRLRSPPRKRAAGGVKVFDVEDDSSFCMVRSAEEGTVFEEASRYKAAALVVQERARCVFGMK